MTGDEIWLTGLGGRNEVAMAVIAQADRLVVSFVPSVMILVIEKFEYAAITSAWIDVEYNESFTNRRTTASGESLYSYNEQLCA